MILNASMLMKCSHCDEGERTPVSNCVICGCGPAPWSYEKLPKTPRGKQLALDFLRSHPNQCKPFAYDWDAEANATALN